jgi:YD repeat-containing protein
VSTTSGRGHGVETILNGTVTVDSSYFTSMDRYITANANGKVLSSNNVQGTNSQTAYFAYGGIIHVFNTGLTGTTTYLTSVGGLIIRPSGTTVGT